MHWNSHITLCLILLSCCVPIQSQPRGLPHVLFLLLYVAVFAYTAHTLYIAVLCTYHNNMYPDPPQRKSFGHLFSRVSLFLPFTFFAVPLDVPTTSKCIQLNSTYEDGVAVALPMSTYEGCCCTYDMQHSLSWLLLLLLIVDQLVYRAASVTTSKMCLCSTVNSAARCRVLALCPCRLSFFFVSFFCLLFLILRRMGKNKVCLLHIIQSWL